MVVLAYLGAVVNEFISSGGRGKKCTQMLFLCLVQNGSRGKCPLFTCKDFFLTVFKCRFMLMSILISIFETIPCQSNNMLQARQCKCWNQYQ